MQIARNYLGDLIVKDETGKPKVYRYEEARLIQRAMNSYAQKKRAGIYVNEVILLNCETKQ